MRILSLSTDNEPCGIATYNGQLRKAFNSLGHTCDVFPIDTEVYLTRAKSELLAHFAPFVERCRSFDAVILQHEYGIYDAGYGIAISLKVFSKVLRQVAALKKPTLVIFHSDPPFITRRWRQLLYGLTSGGRAWAAIVRTIKRSPHVRVVVHGFETRRRFIDRGIPAARILQIFHPFPEPGTNADWKPKDAQREDIVLTIFGFLAPYKGYETVLQALNLLPVNYRLIVAGGPHPRAASDRTLNKLLEALGVGRFASDIAPSPGPPIGAPRGIPPQLGIGDRIPSVRKVTITGWLDDEAARAVLAATDIVLAPYSSKGPSGSGAVTWGLSASRPVIATKTRPFLEINRAAPCMRLVTENAPFELAREILSVASDPAAQERMVTMARKFAAEHTWTSTARHFLSLLDAQRRSV